MSENRRLDESFSVSEFVKSLTGKGTTTIDLSSVQISPSGEMQPASTQPIEASQSQANNAAPASTSSDSE